MSHATNALNTPGKWIVSFSLFECGIIHDANLASFFHEQKNCFMILLNYIS